MICGNMIDREMDAADGISQQGRKRNPTNRTLTKVLNKLQSMKRLSTEIITGEQKKSECKKSDEFRNRNRNSKFEH